MQIPISIFSRTTRVAFPTLKKRSRVAAAVPAIGQKSDTVIVERTYHVADDANGEEIKPEDRLKGHRYGGAIVPMSEYDEAALRYSCDRTLTTLGFALVASIGPEHNVHHIDTVAADKGDRWAICAFESLVNAMREEGRVLIARYCFRKDSPPLMVGLLPEDPREHEASTLVMQYLPFEEDIREWPFASLPVPSTEQRQAVEALMDAAELEVTVGGAVGSHAAVTVESDAGAPPKPHRTEELLRPEEMRNPSLRRFYNFLIQRALDPKATLPATPSELVTSVSMPVSAANKLAAGDVAGLLKGRFGLQRVEKQGKKTKKFWREAIADKRKECSVGEVDTKRIRVDCTVKKDEKREKDEDDEKVKFELHAAPPATGAASSAAEAPMMAQPVLPPPRVHVGSVNPERDFEHWLTTRTGGVDTVGPAIQQMSELIERLADEDDDFLGKAFSSLTVLRKGCVKEGEVDAFNNFVRKLSLRAPSSARRKRLWQRARDAELGLITDKEVATSAVTAEEARAFLAGQDSAPRKETGDISGSAVPMSEKDLEDMLQ